MSGLFNLPPRSTREGDSLLASKATAKAKKAGGTIKGGGGNLLEKIATITAMVKQNLGKYASKYEVIRDEKELEKYIDKCIAGGVISIDTETNSLDTITCTLAGLCLYTPSQKAVYVPLHHVSYVTGVEVNNQISDEFATKQMERVRDSGIDVIMFNAKFDIRVITHQLGVKLRATWDGYVAARLLNENEPSNNLKGLHKKYCMQGEGDAFTFDSMFRGIPFTHIPINTGYLYAARDAEITYELYKFQEPFLTMGGALCIEKDLEGVASLYHNIELPLISVVAEMEDTGIAFDFEYADVLSKKYNLVMVEKEEEFNKICKRYETQIDSYRLSKGSANKLGNPINIASPTQIAILLYDIFGLNSGSTEKPRGTGEDILKGIDHPIVKTILDYREVAKLLGTYVDKMPGITNPKTRRIHASFNQMGADTGRFSSSDPNMQNIPSHNKDIRKMFKATDGYLLVSSDYSAQEPRITAHMSNDVKMIEAYIAGKDLYVEIASLAFGKPYEECQEFRPDGTKNPEGKKRRGMAKAIVLGVCYGKGVPAIAQDLGVTKNEAQKIYDKIMVEFPGLAQFMVDSEVMAFEKGYVDTVWGRKRRLPNMQLEPYEFTFVGGISNNFDPMFDDDFDDDFEEEVSDEARARFTKILDRTWNRREKENIKAQAKAEGILIKENGGYIAEATRQCVNARIQGSAADQIKKAMILVGNDVRLKELGFRLLLPVHDELIGECPKENIKDAAPIFADLMIKAAADLKVPSKCDIEVTDRWYGDVIEIGL